MLNQDYTELHLKFTKLLIKEKNRPTYCIKKSSEANILNCNHGICVADMHSIKDSTPFITGGCANKYRNSTITRIITNPNESDRTVRHDIYYTCMFHGCNNVTTAYNLINIVNTSYDVNKIIYGEKIDNDTLSNIITKPYFSRISLNNTSTKEIPLTTSIINTAIHDFQSLSIFINLFSQMITYILYLTFD